MAEWRNYTEREHVDVHTVTGTLKVLEQVWSPHLGNARDILVYLPPSYYIEQERHYPVIYTHDGQNLFDHMTCVSVEWGMDEAIEELSLEGIEAIVVGICNAGADRMDEYSPVFDHEEQGGGKGEPYLSAIVETLKPLIDADFRTLPDRDHTGIMGSSMGGLISLYAFFRYPDVFGLVGALSPSLWFGDSVIYHIVEAAPPIPGRIYLDAGTFEKAQDEPDEMIEAGAPGYYCRLVRDMRDLLIQKGYEDGEDLLYLEEPGAGHDEGAWQRRLPIALRFLLDGTPNE
jgi:predicted alpha/beta superfamily hydrolase